MSREIFLNINSFTNDAIQISAVSTNDKVKNVATHNIGATNSAMMKSYNDIQNRLESIFASYENHLDKLSKALQDTAKSFEQIDKDATNAFRRIDKV